MGILPRMKCTIRSSKTPQEVRRIMEEETVAREGVVCVSLTDAAFIGEVGETDFKVMQHLPFVRDDFQPVIIGHIRPQGDGTIVDVHMRMTWFVIAFCAVWFCMTGLFFLISLLGQIAGQPDGWKMIASSAGFFLFGQILARAGFYIPARRARRKLEDLFNGVAEDGWEADD